MLRDKAAENKRKKKVRSGKKAPTLQEGWDDLPKFAKEQPFTHRFAKGKKVRPEESRAQKYTRGNAKGMIRKARGTAKVTNNSRVREVRKNSPVCTVSRSTGL